MGRPLHILGFESFDGGSHRAVRERISAHSRHEWTWFLRPDRGWKWRMRAAALEFAEESASAAGDVLFVTSLLDAAHLAAVRSRLSPGPRLPLVLYRHENQAAYPVQDLAPEVAQRDIQFALTDLASLAAADLTIWNSRWNRDSARQGLSRLLRPAPDLDRHALLDRAFARSTVLAPPVEAPPPDSCRLQRPAHVPGDPVRVLWPHRWEHDKGPDELLAVMEREAGRLNLRLTLLGSPADAVRPPAMERLISAMADRIDHAGYLPDRAAYWRHVARCDWVLSTARHEFFGIAVAEALLAGSLPWLPNRLSYPELVPADLLGCSPYAPPEDPDDARRRITRHLEHALPERAVGAIDDAIERTVMESRVPVDERHGGGGSDRNPPVSQASLNPLPKVR